MTIDKFNKTSWGANMTCIFNGQERKISSVNFDQELIGLSVDSNEDDLDWVRCENINLIVPIF